MVSNIRNKDKSKINTRYRYQLSDSPYELLENIFNEETKKYILILENRKSKVDARCDALFIDTLFFGRTELKSTSKLKIAENPYNEGEIKGLTPEHRRKILKMKLRLRKDKVLDILTIDKKWNIFLDFISVLNSGIKKRELRKRHWFVTDEFKETISSFLLDVRQGYKEQKDKIEELDNLCEHEISMIKEKYEGKKSQVIKEIKGG